MASPEAQDQAGMPAEEDIRTRAYQLWLAAGSPDGRAEEYWEEARQQLMAARPADGGQPATGSPD